MISKDYIMRMIEELSSVLASVLFHKKQNNPAEAEQLLETAMRDNVGLDCDVIQKLAPQDFINLININQDKLIAGNKLIAAGKLLFEKTLIGEELGNAIKEIQQNYYKSLSFLVAGLTMLDPDESYHEFVKDVDIIFHKLPVEEINGDMKLKLFHLYESYGQFNHAENILFQLKEIQFPDIINTGKVFYAKLESLSDVELRNRHFSREEIKQGMKDLLN